MIAIITARGGSKRIPGKNIKDFCGKPIIAYSIELAIASGLFTEVMVSTDSPEIASVAKAYGAQVPFMRSEKNSDDFAGTADVILEVLACYQNQGQHFEKGCCIYPTAPLLTVKTLKQGFELLESGEFGVVFPIVKYSYPIQRSLLLEKDNAVKMQWPENYPKRSQDLSPVYHDAGQFYWFQTSYLQKEKKLFGHRAGGLVIDNLYAQDIDNESDWKIAEFKLKYLKQIEK